MHGAVARIGRRFGEAGDYYLHIMRGQRSPARNGKKRGVHPESASGAAGTSSTPAALCVAAFVLANSSATGAESCGKLCDFERSATKTETPTGRTRTDNRGGSRADDEEDGLGTLLVRSFAEIMLVGIVEGGASSNLRARGGSERMRARLDGEGLIPRLRVDLSRQRIDHATDAWDLRVEAGDGALGLQGRATRYREEVAGTPGAVSRLDFRQAHLLYRMAGESFEVDLGVGVLQMSGQATHTAFSFTLPVLVHPMPWFGVEYRPAWSTIADNTIRDQELALVLGGPYAALRLGYRRIDSDGGTGGAILQGPFAGLSLRF